MLIAGDIGATHTRLAIVEIQDQQPVIICQKNYSSRLSYSLEEIVKDFLVSYPNYEIEAACFAVPGPVIDGKCKTTNLPWHISVKDLQDNFSLPRVFLINDVEGHAWMLTLKQKAKLLPVYQPSFQLGNYALIAPGTGLGEAGLLWNGDTHLPFASEGGHCDFAPKNEEQWNLRKVLERKWGHVSYERVLSGPGFVELYMFYRDFYHFEEPAWLTEQLRQNDPAVVLTDVALEQKLPSCEKALNCFISILADEIGNCALKYLARGGVFLAGGILYKLRRKLQEPIFLQTYLDKGRLSSLLQSISITVIDDQLSCVRGAARYADVHLRG